MKRGKACAHFSSFMKKSEVNKIDIYKLIKLCQIQYSTNSLESTQNVRIREYAKKNDFPHNLV